MTMCIALRCRDGLVVATDGKVTRASMAYRAVARIWQRTNKTHAVAPRALVTGAGELAMIHAVVEALQDAPEDVRTQGLDALAPLAQETLVQERAAAIARYRTIYGPGGDEHAPQAAFLLVEADPEPRLVYVSEDGDLEDQTHLGYAVIGSGDLIVHVRLQSWDTAELTTEQGAVLAYGLIRDTIDSGTFRVSDPVQVWTLQQGASPDEWDDARLEKLAERHRAFLAAMHDALRSA